MKSLSNKALGIGRALIRFACGLVFLAGHSAKATDKHLKDFAAQEKIFLIESTLDLKKFDSTVGENWYQSTVAKKLNEVSGVIAQRKVYAQRFEDPQLSTYLVGVLVRVSSPNMTQTMLQLAADSRMRFYELSNMEQLRDDTKDLVEMNLQAQKRNSPNGQNSIRPALMERIAQASSPLGDYLLRFLNTQRRHLHPPTPPTQQQIVESAEALEVLAIESWAILDGINKFTKSKEEQIAKKFFAGLVQHCYINRFSLLAPSDYPSLKEIRFTFMGNAQHFTNFFDSADPKQPKKYERVTQAFARPRINHAFVFPVLGISDPIERKRYAQAIVKSWLRSRDHFASEVLAMTSPMWAGLTDETSGSVFTSPFMSSTQARYYLDGVLETLSLLTSNQDTNPEMAALRSQLKVLGPKITSRLELLIKATSIGKVKQDSSQILRLNILKQSWLPQHGSCMPQLGAK